MTLSALMARVTQQLQEAHLAYGHGTTNAHDEAAWLVLWQLGLPLHTDLHDLAQRPISPAEQTAVAALIERRISSREPAAYLTQEAWLQGLPFYVDRRSIIPRSFIAELIVQGSLDPWLHDRTHAVLDLCTGNASLAILSAHTWPEVQITAADICPQALEVARINIDKHGLQARIRPVQSDGLAACPGPWDLVLCNPPYVNSHSMQNLPPEYRAEPALALAGGIDGMDFIRDLLPRMAAHLAPHGVLVLEIGHEQAHFEAAFPKLETIWMSTSSSDEHVALLTHHALLTLS